MVLCLSSLSKELKPSFDSGPALFQEVLSNGVMLTGRTQEVVAEKCRMSYTDSAGSNAFPSSASETVDDGLTAVCGRYRFNDDIRNEFWLGRANVSRHSAHRRCSDD